MLDLEQKTNSKQRKQVQNVFILESKSTFAELVNYHWGPGKFNAIKSSWLENELKYVTPHNTTNISDIQYVVRFIMHYSEDHTILLPGRVPGYKRDNIQLLPSSVTKREVW